MLTIVSLRGFEPLGKAERKEKIKLTNIQPQEILVGIQILLVDMEHEEQESIFYVDEASIARTQLRSQLWKHDI